MKTARNITLVSLLAAGVLSVPAYAHEHLEHYVDRSAVKVTGTYTEPNQFGFDFAAAATGAGADYVEFVGVKQEFDWGIGLEHRMDNGVSRLFLDYDHYDADQSSRFNTDPTGQRDLLFGGVGGGGAGTIVESFGEYDIRTDTFKVGTRHRLEFGHQYRIDLGAALSWIDLDRDFRATQTDNANPANVATLNEEMDFDAFGPYFDVSAKYFLHGKNMRGFNLQAYAGAGLLYSESKYRATLVRPGVDTEVFDREKIKGVTAELAGRLAVGWDYRLCNKSTFSTALGWMMVHYKNALDYAGMGGSFSVSFSEQERSGTSNSSSAHSFTRQGPFLEFKWSGHGF